MSKLWTQPANPSARLVLVQTRIQGPLGRTTDPWLVLDTGTPVTILRIDVAIALDLTADRAIGRSRLFSPTGPQDGYVVRPASLTLMGQTLTDLPIHCHDLDPDLQVDGLVGLDVIRRGDLRVHLAGSIVEFRWT